MRTKALLLTAAVAAAGIVSPMAQVYSVNAVGYVSKTYEPGFNLIANPLDAEDNTIGALFGDAPDGSNFYKWNGSSFDIATKLPDFLGGWDLPDITLNPGEGGFINPGGSYSVTFVGEVVQGETLSVSIPVGFSIVGSQVPIAGNVADLGLEDDLTDGDNIYEWTGDGYTIHTLLPDFLGGGWDPNGTVTLDIGQAVFVNASAATSWDRSFSVNQ